VPGLVFAQPRHLRPALVAALTLSAVATGSSDAADRGAAPAVPACTYGRLPDAMRGFLPAQVASAIRAFGQSVGDLPPQDRARATSVFERGLMAYLYGMPTVLLRETVARYPKNSLYGLGRLAGPSAKTVVAPNHDTLYSVSRLDLTAEPIVIDAPATHGRYSVVQLLDADTNAFAYIGAGADRDHASTVLVAPPDWHGAAPAGVRVVRSPTKIVWYLGRTLISDDADTAAANDLMRQYSATPLSAWLQGARATEQVVPHAPERHVTTVPKGLAFYDALGAAMAIDPPREADACAAAYFAGAGIAAGQTDAVARRGLTAAATAGARLVDAAVDRTRRSTAGGHNGWTVLLGDIADFGTDYANRAVIARVGLASNTPPQAIYPTADSDSTGRRLSGAHRYVITFKKGQLPPVRAFWSLTMYDDTLALSANRIDRYALGDRTKGLRYGKDGSLTIYVQHAPPRGRKTSNWLPAPSGRFVLYLRLYEPKPAAAQDRWMPPAIQRVG
jgi:hypothetical protein